MNHLVSSTALAPDRRAVLRNLAGLAACAALAGLTTGCGGGSSDAPAGPGNQTGNGPSGTGSGGTGDGGTGTGTGTAPRTKSAKRGIAYDLASDADLAALAPGVSWWYNWSSRPSASAPADAAARHGMDFVPMLWNGNFDAAQVQLWLLARPEVKHLLVLNEPNLIDQANLLPSAAAALWPRYEAVAKATGVKIVGPAMTWGTMAGYANPVAWLDAFYAAYRSAHGRDPQVDCLAFHWYDYGLNGQLEALAKYGKPFWVTEFANWHSQADGAQIDSVAKQMVQMTEMVNVCESRSDVLRYAWFIGRMSPDPHFTSLLADPGVLTALGRHYLSLPHAG